MALIRQFLGLISALYELQRSAANAVCVSALLSSSFQSITGDTAFTNFRGRSTYISEGNKKKREKTTLVYRWWTVPAPTTNNAHVKIRSERRGYFPQRHRRSYLIFCPGIPTALSYTKLQFLLRLGRGCKYGHRR